MSETRCELEAVAVVLAGRFNPSIFQPQWFARYDLVRPQEVEDAKVVIEIIRPEVAVFTMGPFRCEVEPQRFAMSTTDLDAFHPLKDLVVGTFSLLDHTPALALGLNRDMHFRMPSDEQWHRVGHSLAPKAIWHGLVREPGMHTLRIIGQREASVDSRLTVTIQPSRRVSPGVFVGVNEHFSMKDGEPISKLMSVLETNWSGSQASARELADELLRRALAERP